MRGAEPPMAYAIAGSISQKQKALKRGLIIGGGKDSAERKVTKCHVSREGQNPPMAYAIAGSIPHNKKALKRGLIIGGGKGN